MSAFVVMGFNQYEQTHMPAYLLVIIFDFIFMKSNKSLFNKTSKIINLTHYSIPVVVLLHTKLIFIHTERLIFCVYCIQVSIINLYESYQH